MTQQELEHFEETYVESCRQGRRSKKDILLKAFDFMTEYDLGFPKISTSDRSRWVYAAAKLLPLFIPESEKAFYKWRRNKHSQHPADIPEVVKLFETCGVDLKKALFEQGLQIIRKRAASQIPEVSQHLFGVIRTVFQRLDRMDLFRIWRCWDTPTASLQDPLELLAFCEYYLSLGGPDDLCTHLSYSTMTKAF